MARILSLSPAATEMVWALEKTSDLIGRSSACDFPSSIQKLPIAPPADKWDAAILRHLSPDVILTQEPISPDLGPKVLNIASRSLSDVWERFQSVSAALNIPEVGTKKTALFRSKLNTLQLRAAAFPKPRVAVFERVDPLTASGFWGPELVALAGGTDLFGTAGAPPMRVEFSRLRSADPDIICFALSGMAMGHVRDALVPFTAQEGWFDLSAIKNNRVFILDGPHFFNRPGPRLVEGAEVLAEIFHPEEFDFGHRNDGWQYWGFDRF